MVVRDIDSWVNFIISIAGFIALTASGIFYFRASYIKQTVEYLRSDVRDANNRADNYKKDIDEMKSKLSEIEALAAERAQELAVLRGLVTGKDQLDRIETLVLSLSGGSR